MQINLRFLIGPIGKRLPFQWIRVFGRKNIISKPENGEPILVSNDYIIKAFYDSKEKQRTTKELANVMLFTYMQWISVKPQTSITGLIAEEIHNKIMHSIATYWRRNWAPEKHKCPIYGIVNLFNLCRNSVQYDYLPALPNKKEKKNGKNLFKRELVDNFESLDILPFDGNFFKNLLSWDCFAPLDIEQLLDFKKRFGYDWEEHGREVDGDGRAL